MSHQSLFEATIPAPPPPTLDVDRLIATSRRRQRHRRMVASAAGVLAVGGILVAVTVTLPAANSAPLIPATASPTSATTFGPDEPPFSVLGGVPATEPPETAKVRLAAAMRDAVLDAAPGVVLGGDFIVSFSSGDARPAPGGGWYGPSYLFGAFQSITVDGAEGDVAIYVERYSLNADGTPIRASCPAELAGGSMIGCQRTEGPGGEIVTAETFEEESASGIARAASACAFREDGSSVCATASNTRRQGEGRLESGVVVSADPPLTTAQLTAIVLDPRITIYP